MALNINTDLRRQDSFPGIAAGALLPGFFLHTTADAALTVAGAGYFDAAADRLPIGSVIVSVTSTGTTPVLTHRIVTANTGTVVTIA